MVHSVGRARIFAVFMLGTLACTLGLAYLLLRPTAGSGASFSTPQAAIIDAFSPTGWLGPVEHLTLYDDLTTDHGHVFAYAGYPPHTNRSNTLPSLFGLADARPGVLGWHAHGMIVTAQPPHLTDATLLTYTTIRRPTLNQSFLVLTGYARQPAVAAVDVTFVTGQTKRVVVQNGTFAVIAAATNDVTRLGARGSDGQVLQTIVITTNS